MKHESYTSYSELSLETVQTIADGLKSIKEEDLAHIAFKKLSLLFPKFNRQFEEFDFKISLESLLGVKDTLARIDVSPHPFQDCPEEVVMGLTMIADGTPQFPIVLMFKPNDDIFTHETIHACQFLQDGSYPLSSNELRMVCKLGILGTTDQLEKEYGINMAWDFAIRMAAWKTWTELEAYYESWSGAADYLRLLDRTNRSALPFVTIQQMGDRYEVSGDQMRMAQEKLPILINQIEQDIPWLRSLRIGQGESLHEDLWWIHDEQETEMQFGPLDDEEEIDPLDLEFFSS